MWGNVKKLGWKWLKELLSKNSTWEQSDPGPVKRNLFIIEVLLLLMVAKEASFVEQED